jgi:peptidoglycan hydrolase-like protein with peptidoglycan-binding domain
LEEIMHKLLIVTLATAALSIPAAAQGPAQNSPRSPSAQSAQPQQSGQQSQSGSNQAAQNETIAPRDLSAQQIKQLQQALNQKGMHAGKTDGKWGRETRAALEKFQKQQGMQANGRLDQQTLSDLGVNVAQSSGAETTGAGPRQQPHRQPGGGQSGRAPK